nr:MAG TPA: hypothetical protein [Caudoviricetes sp.]
MERKHQGNNSRRNADIYVRWQSKLYRNFLLQKQCCQVGA